MEAKRAGSIASIFRQSYLFLMPAPKVWLTSTTRLSYVGLIPRHHCPNNSISRGTRRTCPRSIANKAAALSTTTMPTILGKAISIPLVLSMEGNCDRKVGSSPLLQLEEYSGVAVFANASHEMSRNVSGRCGGVLHMLFRNVRVTNFSWNLHACSHP